MENGRVVESGDPYLLLNEDLERLRRGELKQGNIQKQAGWEEEKQEQQKSNM